jgi:hypothetical protein
LGEGGGGGARGTIRARDDEKNPLDVGLSALLA